jgi:hypothetical protein
VHNFTFRPAAAPALILVMAGLSLSTGPAAHAQNKTEYEKRQEEDVRDMRYRRQEADRVEKMHQDARTQLQDQQAVERAKAAGDAAYKVWGEQQDATFARHDAERRAANRVTAEQSAAAKLRQVAANDPYRQAAIAELATRPPPMPAPGSFTECDRLASAPSDDTRPLGVEGVETNAINVALALPACRSEASRSQAPARVKYQLGRSLIAAGSCKDGYQLLYDARMQGNTAAHLAMAYGASDSCYSPHPYRLQIEDAFAEGNGAAGLVLIEEELGPVETISPSANTDKFAPHAAKAIALLKPRAEAGDAHAIQMIAALSAIPFAAHPLGEDERKKWVFRCIARSIVACDLYASVGWSH